MQTSRWRQALPCVDPLPPVAGPSLPWVGAGLSLLRDPTAFLARSRARLGDTFLVDAFGWRLFCLFSPEGVRALYALPEQQASFGLATFNLVFRHKAPLELVNPSRGTSARSTSFDESHEIANRAEHCASGASFVSHICQRS